MSSSLCCLLHILLKIATFIFHHGPEAEAHRSRRRQHHALSGRGACARAVCLLRPVTNGHNANDSACGLLTATSKNAKRFQVGLGPVCSRPVRVTASNRLPVCRQRSTRTPQRVSRHKEIGLLLLELEVWRRAGGARRGAQRAASNTPLPSMVALLCLRKPQRPLRLVPRQPRAR